MRNKLPPYYAQKKLIAPEVTTRSGIIIYWVGFFFFLYLMVLLPLLLSENQLSQTNQTHMTSKISGNAEWQILLILLACVLGLWFLHEFLHKSAMRFFGGKFFSSGRTLSDVKFLQSKKYIPTILIRFWTVNHFFSRGQYLFMVLFPFLVITPILLAATFLALRNSMNFLYIQTTWIFHAVYIFSDLYLSFILLAEPYDSYLLDSSNGLTVYHSTEMKPSFE